jgi:PadR family transcriptional regulator, regulatory protein PadR
MPGGRGYGKGRGSGRRKMFFLESCLLVLLRREPGYGYSLMEGLSEFGFNNEQMDISILYRALRELEEFGLVASSWSDESLGPKRRMYTLTPQGEAVLAEWMESLRQRRREIETLEAAYDAAMRNVA